MTITDFAPIDLAELNDQAALQTRVDRKYLVPTETATALARWLHPETRVLTIDGCASQEYHSVYFDTPDLHSYLLTARRRRGRFKVRTRAYRDTGTAFLEVKTRGARGLTHKVRIPHTIDDLDELAPPARLYVAAALAEAGPDATPVWQLAPTLTTTYRRTTLLLPPSGAQGPTRLTIDTDLEWRLVQAGRPTIQLYRPDLAIIETKSCTGAGPADQLLWQRGIRPIAFSKYATGLAALRPDLPANRWSRVLRTTLTPGTPIAITDKESA
ncbi:polyphosphate polymerase domain-containing protein [Propionibacteriaceae bacterium Y1923]